jgi:hypothetical protein
VVSLIHLLRSYIKNDRSRSYIKNDRSRSYIKNVRSRSFIKTTEAGKIRLVKKLKIIKC